MPHMTDEIQYDKSEIEDSGDSEENTSTDPVAKIAKLKKQLKEALEQKQEYLDGWQRSKADYINLKKRTEEEKSALRDYATEDFALAVISVVDSFEMALRNEKSLESVPKDWADGMKYIYNQLVSVLAGYDIKALNPMGEMYDVNKHTAKEMVKVDSESDNGKIVEVIQKGYEFKGKMIRHAVVKVGEVVK